MCQVLPKLSFFFVFLYRMNAANAPRNTSGGGPAKLVVGVVFLILVLVALYYLYQYLYGKNPSQGSVDLLTGNIPMTQTVQDASGNKSVAINQLSGVLDGGEYSTSFWMYVADTKGLAGTSQLAHLMEISKDRVPIAQASRGNTLLFVGLSPVDGTLVVRQNTSDPSTYAIDNTLGDANGTSTKYPLEGLIKNYNSSASPYKNDSRCDIINGIEYQRWILVTVVGNGRTLDVYIDGKLARSCVYQSSFALNSSDGKATAYFGLNNDSKLKGYFSAGKFYNYALTPDAVWALYQQGPGGSFSITDWFKNLFNVNVSFSNIAGTQ
jgi:hypothetical protein